MGWPPSNAISLLSRPLSYQLPNLLSSKFSGTTKLHHETWLWWYFWKEWNWQLILYTEPAWYLPTWFVPKHNKKIQNHSIIGMKKNKYNFSNDFPAFFAPHWCKSCWLPPEYKIITNTNSSTSTNTISGMILLLSSLLIKGALAANPAEDLQNCLQTNTVLDDCLKEWV